MSEKDFLFYYLLGIPLMIWSATLVLAFIRICHKNQRDLTEERKKWEDQHRMTAYNERKRRIVVRRKRRKPSRDQSKTPESSAGSRGSAASGVSKEPMVRTPATPRGRKQKV